MLTTRLMKKSLLIDLSMIMWCMVGQVCVAQSSDDYNLIRAIDNFNSKLVIKQ